MRPGISRSFSVIVTMIEWKPAPLRSFCSRARPPFGATSSRSLTPSPLRRHLVSQAAACGRLCAGRCVGSTKLGRVAQIVGFIASSASLSVQLRGLMGRLSSSLLDSPNQSARHSPMPTMPGFGNWVTSTGDAPPGASSSHLAHPALFECASSNHERRPGPCGRTTIE